MLNVINGGAHASNNLDVQEYMIIPAGFDTFHAALRAAAEIYQHLKKLLHDGGKQTAVGDEGGFAPDFRNNEEPLQYIERAVRRAGYEPGRHIYLGLDVAASEFFRDGAYHFRHPKPHVQYAEELVEQYSNWVRKYPIVSIEDGLAENDWRGWTHLTGKLGHKIQLVGDDLFVTNVKRLQQGIRGKAANAVLIKPNQVGTVSETLDCVRVATDHGYRTVISHRSGETVDHFIADLAVAANSGQIKSGAPCRSDRVAKYNRLIRIEEDDVLRYAGLATLKR
jgi:enolase